MDLELVLTAKSMDWRQLYAGAKLMIETHMRLSKRRSCKCIGSRTGLQNWQLPKEMPKINPSSVPMRK